jgi:hypothetical protein
MDNDNKTAVRPKVERMVNATNARAVKVDTTRRNAARKAYRAKIESLLNESKYERLADVWQRVCPFSFDPASGLPDRRGIIKDLADFAEVLQPSVDGMKAHRLCGLVEKYAAYDSRQSGLCVSLLAQRTGVAELRSPKRKS